MELLSSAAAACLLRERHSGGESLFGVPTRKPVCLACEKGSLSKVHVDIQGHWFQSVLLMLPSVGTQKFKASTKLGMANILE